MRKYCADKDVCVRIPPGAPFIRDFGVYMTVSELIEFLKTFDSDLTVRYLSDENGQDEIDVKYIFKNHKDYGPLLV